MFGFNLTVNQCDGCVVRGVFRESHDVWLSGTTCHSEYAGWTTISPICQGRVAAKSSIIYLHIL